MPCGSKDILHLFTSTIAKVTYISTLINTHECTLFLFHGRFLVDSEESSYPPLIPHDNFFHYFNLFILDKYARKSLPSQSRNQLFFFFPSYDNLYIFSLIENIISLNLLIFSPILTRICEIYIFISQILNINF